MNRSFIKRIASLAVCWSVMIVIAFAQASVKQPKKSEAPVTFVSEGDTLRGTIFVANGAGPRPTVLYLNGFPGSPEIPDFLKPIREAGANILFFNYRGTWGSDGLFSPDNVLADTEAALGFLRSPKARSEYRIDPDAIVVYGISFGGWAALSLAAKKPRVECIAARAISNIGAFGRQWRASEPFREAWRQNLDRITSELPIRLEGGVEGAMKSIMERADEYDVARLAPALSNQTVILFGAKDDEVAPFALSYQPVADALKGTEMADLTLVTAHGGHEDARPEWETRLVRWLYDDCLDERYRPAGRLKDAKKSYQKKMELAEERNYPSLETYRANLQGVTKQLEQKNEKRAKELIRLIQNCHREDTVFFCIRGDLLSRSVARLSSGDCRAFPKSHGNTRNDTFFFISLNRG